MKISGQSGWIVTIDKRTTEGQLLPQGAFVPDPFEWGVVSPRSRRLAKTFLEYVTGRKGFAERNELDFAKDEISSLQPTWEKDGRWIADWVRLRADVEVSVQEKMREVFSTDTQKPR